MKRVLIETRMNALKLNESKAPKKGCLGRLEGVCADFKNKTRNGRLYPLKLWKKVFDDSLFKESLENKTLFGELDHPEDRFEPLMTEACVVMTDYRIDEDAGLIYGGFDILDTPKGRILKSILDYGSVLGVSSRGQGDIVETADGEQVDEDTYDFACFDVVSTPAVAKARQNVIESIQRVQSKNIEENIRQQISDAETVADLNIIRSVVRSSQLNSSEIDSLVESIEDRCKSLQAAEDTILAKSEDEPKQVSSLKESANTIRDNKQLYSCIRQLRQQVSALKHRESRYIESIHASEDKIHNLETKINRLKTNTSQRTVENKRVQESLNRRLDNVSSKYEQADAKLLESTNRINRLTSKNNELIEQLNVANDKLQSLKRKQENDFKILESTKSQLVKSKSECDALKEQISTMLRKHSSQLDEANSEADEYAQLLSNAKDTIENGYDRISSLEESLDTANSEIERLRGINSDLSKFIKSYQTTYLAKVSSANGINPSVLKESIHTSTTPKQIDEMVKSIRHDIDRRNKLGITEETIESDSNNIIAESIKHTGKDADNEDERLDSFLNMASTSM